MPCVGSHLSVLANSRMPIMPSQKAGMELNRYANAGKTPVQQSAMVFARVQAQPATQNHRQDGACAGEQQRVPNRSAMSTVTGCE